MKLLDDVLVVPPFDCAWLSGKELEFTSPGKGCIIFQAKADNDVTVVFKQRPGCKHYRTDSDPNYTVVIGSHGNRRIKIAANGTTVLDVASLLHSPLVFENYWISLDGGYLTVGKGCNPGQGMLCQWQDTDPNSNKVQFVGLSSWDKHVAYRNVKVVPPALHCPQSANLYWTSGFAAFLESVELSDFHFVVGPERRNIPAHRVILLASSNIDMEHSPFLGRHMELPCIEYEAIHAALKFVYTGRTEVHKHHLCQLRDIANKFGIYSLSSQLVAIDEVDFTSYSTPDSSPPIDSRVFRRLLDSGSLSDVEIYLEDQNLTLQLHRLVLSVWSAPFAKMFTNGFQESKESRVTIKDIVDRDAFTVMLRYIYSGGFGLEEEVEDAGSIMLPLLILADRFGMHLLQQQCHDYLLEFVNKDSAVSILNVASSILYCERLINACIECCAKHLDYCLAEPATEFKDSDVQTIEKILQRPDLLVTSEEKVLNAVILWGAKMDVVNTWEDADARFKTGLEVFACDELKKHVKRLLSWVRFPLMPTSLLDKLQSSVLLEHLPELKDLVLEAVDFHKNDPATGFTDDQKDSWRVSNQGRLVNPNRTSLRFTRRPSSFKPLLYLCDGDCNGVFYHAGTSYGLHPWMNPMLTKEKITISASSPRARYTDPKVLVSRNYQATSYAGPCIEEGRQVSWWKVDLGPKHKLMCNYYTVRQDGSSNFVRSWSFQGSCDGNSWTDLRLHKNDHSLCRPGQFASWPVHSANALISFRYFRVVQNQPTTFPAGPWNLSFCYLELYGYFL